MTMREFLSGEAFDCYTHFGAHPTRDGVRFRVYAPNARFVQLIGECNHWQGEEMYREEQGCWTVTLPQAWIGMLYKWWTTTTPSAFPPSCGRTPLPVSATFPASPFPMRSG